MRDAASAEKAFRAASNINPKAPNVHFGLGYLLWAQRKWTDAATEFELELQNDPRHTKARAYLADTLVRQNQYARALPSWKSSQPILHQIPSSTATSD